MSTVTTPAPATITTLQGIEQFAEETEQDFFDLVLERFDVLRRSTATELHYSAQRQGVRGSDILRAADAIDPKWTERDR